MIDAREAPNLRDAGPLMVTLVKIVLASLVTLLAISSSACAQEERARALASPVPAITHDASQFALDISVLTAFPIAIGAAMALEVPGHVVLRVSAGAVPNAYVDAVNDIGMDAGAWSARDATVASALLAGATYLEFALGIRPMGTPGIELSIGYVMLWSHRIVGMGLVGQTGDRALGLDLSIDAVHAELAWQTELADHVYFRIALGWAHAFANHLSLVTEAPDEATRAALAQAERALSETIGRHAFGPTLAAALGARF